MNKFLAFFLILFSILPTKAEMDTVNRRLLGEVKHLFSELEFHERLRNERLDSIRSMRRTLPNSIERVLLTQQLADIYMETNLDSSMIYWSLAEQEARSLNLSNKVTELRMRLLSHYPLVGPSLDAVNSFEKLDTASMDRRMKNKYWVNSARLYYYIQHFYPAGKAKNLYMNLTLTSYDSLRNYYPHESVQNALIDARMQELRGEKTLAVASLLEILPSLESNFEDYEEALKTIIKYYSSKPNHRQIYLHCLLSYVKAVIQRGIVRPYAMAETGKILYEEGEKDLGRELILTALTRHESRNIGEPFDYARYVSYLSAQTRIVRFWIAVIIAFLLVLVIALAILMIRGTLYSQKSHARCTNKLRKMQARIIDAEKIASATKTLNFMLQEQLSDYNLHVTRRLKAGQVRELYNDIENGDYVEIQKDKFFTSFDEIFLNLFPDFIERLNELFVPGKELSLLPGKRMTPELRIAAYMRLGITDSARLSAVLGLSINTIYTYRNRLKGRAFDRNLFETKLQNWVNS